MISDKDLNRILELVTCPEAFGPFELMAAPDVVEERGWTKIVPNIPVRINNYFQPGQWALYNLGKIIFSSKSAA